MKRLLPLVAALALSPAAFSIPVVSHPGSNMVFAEGAGVDDDLVYVIDAVSQVKTFEPDKIDAAGSTAKLSSMTITSIQAATISGTSITGYGNYVPIASGVNATDYRGVEYPNNDGAYNPGNNVGKLGDGLLNGETKNLATYLGSGETAKGNNKTNYFLSPNEFLDNDDDQWLRDGDPSYPGSYPGWIRLADTDCGGKTNCEGATVNYDTVGDTAGDENEDWFDIGDFLELTWGTEVVDGNKQGTWSLEITNLEKLLTAEELIKGEGGVPTYDHLTFVLKGNNSSDPSWFLFDFNFHDLIDAGVAINFETFYRFEGTWDVNVFSNDEALSHWSVWVHDPTNPEGTVPTPAPLLLISAMLLLLRHRFKH